MVTLVSMSRAAVDDGIQLEYDTFGSADDSPLLLVMGLGGQMIGWDADFCRRIADEGFFVIRFDNRDIGLSSRVVPEGFDYGTAFGAAFTGQPFEPPYRLVDMAADTVGLLDHLGIERVHAVGASLGGMIVQTLAIEHPERLLSATSMMSTTGDRSVGQATAEATTLLTQARPNDRDAFVAATVESERILNGPVVPFDEQRVAERAGEAYDRSHDREGVGRQLLAVLASPDRTEALGGVEVPFLVIHGDADPLIAPSGGEATARAVPGAELVTIEGMGHNVPPVFWDRIVDVIVAHARKAG